MVLDVRKLTTIADYFVICTTTNERQARAVTETLRTEMKRRGRHAPGQEGSGDGAWVLQDLSDVVVHVFSEDQRGFYDLDGLWADAPRVRWNARTRTKEA